ncbi:MAG: hypothetical protein JSW43_06720 [Gemmatimonadota bacterium]|nr:MAG: hypothetical protein JSW43_06720 [Gemmatimonadota bacterium]
MAAATARLMSIAGPLAIAGVVAWAEPVGGQWVLPTFYRATGEFAEARLIESSGVAVSRRHPGVLWTHNDGGHEPWLYATNLLGEDLGHYRIAGADARDWEDIALGPCPDVPTTCLYIADTGDNLYRRREAAIYIVEEPAVLPPPGKKAEGRLQAGRVRVRYPGGPFDVEALTVAPDGEVLLITKGQQGRIRRFRVPIGRSRDTSVMAVDQGVLDIVPQRMLGRLVTGAAVSPSGRRLVVRTYTEIDFYWRGPDAIVREGRPCWLGLREPQGEAVDFWDEDLLVLTSEAPPNGRGSIALVRCPTPGPEGSQ